MPPADWQSAIEIHPANWVCPAERFWVAGWMTSTAGLVPVDVRAWLGEVPFLGLCGLPRPDKESAARGQAGPPQAGFSFLLDPIPGATLFRAEVCDQHGCWTEIFRSAITSAANAAPAAPTPPDARVLLDLLRTQHRRPGERASSLAHEVLTAARARTFDVMPSEPFKGALEQLEDDAAVQYDHVLVTGWVAHRTQRIRRLTAFLDTAHPVRLLAGLPRPDARQLFPDLVDADHSRFAGYLPLPRHAPHPLALRIFAETHDGAVALVFLKRFRPVLTSARGLDLPPYSLLRFLRAGWALQRAGWGRTSDPAAVRAARAQAKEAYRLAAPQSTPPVAASVPTAAALPRRATRVVLVTHNLNFEGAPLFLAELAEHLSRQPDWTVRLVSAADGPLRTRFERAGIAVSALEATAVQHADSDADFAAAIGALALDPAWKECDVVVANTLVSFWAVHLAKHLGLPAVLHVHESAPARRFFARTLATDAIARVEAAFTLADRVVFVAQAAMRVHAALGRNRNFCTVPGWVDVNRVESFAIRHNRDALRRELDLPPDATVFLNLGSVLPRKGQLVHIAAIAALQQAEPAVPQVHLFVGGGTGIDPYADLVRDAAAHHNLSSVRFIPQVPDPYRYLHAADICVCSSLEEAFPRVVLEAAAFGRHIVSTDVDGVPEMLDASSAWLVPPGSPFELSYALRDALQAQRRGDRSRPERARAHIRQHFRADSLLTDHTNLIRAVASGQLD